MLRISRRLVLAGLIATLAGGALQAQDAYNVTVDAPDVYTRNQFAPLVRQAVLNHLAKKPHDLADTVIHIRLRTLTLEDMATARNDWDDDENSWHGSRGGATDQLDSEVTIERGKTVIASFPLFVTHQAQEDPPWSMGPSRYRLERLADTYAYWLVQKL